MELSLLSRLYSPRLWWIAFVLVALPALTIFFLLLYNISILNEGIARGETTRGIIVERQQIIMSNQQRIMGKLDTLIARGGTL